MKDDDAQEPDAISAVKRTQHGQALSGIRWRPNQDTLAALLSYVLVVATLYVAFQFFTTDRVAANFITFGPVGLALIGIGIPVFYTVLVRDRSLADLGITTHHLLPSLALALLLGYDTFRNTLANLGVTWDSTLVPLIAMTLTVGLFEAIFFRGWLQLRFESAFGMIPGLLLSALLYSLYHVGYGMALEEMAMLFFLGIVFGGMFRLTRNILVLWPFYTPVGSLYSNLSEGLTLPFEATYGFVLTIALMVALVTVSARLSRGRPGTGPGVRRPGRRKARASRRSDSDRATA